MLHSLNIVASEDIIHARAGSQDRVDVHCLKDQGRWEAFWSGLVLVFPPLFTLARAFLFLRAAQKNKKKFIATLQLSFRPWGYSPIKKILSITILVQHYFYFTSVHYFPLFKVWWIKYVWESGVNEACKASIKI